MAGFAEDRAWFRHCRPPEAANTMTTNATQARPAATEAPAMKARILFIDLVPKQAPLAPLCCNQTLTADERMGIREIRALGAQFEGGVLWHIVYQLRMFGMPATRLLESLDAESGPALTVFRCTRCGRNHFHIDQI